MASRTFKNSDRYQAGDSFNLRLSGVGRTLNDKTGIVFVYHLQKPIGQGVSVNITCNASSTSERDNCYVANGTPTVSHPFFENGGAVFIISSIAETQMNVSVRNANSVELFNTNGVYLVEIPACTISFT